MSNYQPPKVWKYVPNEEGAFGSMNRPTSGAREEKKLPVGDHNFQLYSLGTPNGVKVTIMFEELLALGIQEAEYNAHLIHIQKGHQFYSGFVEINPNSKIPALIDNSGEQPVRVFESCNILLHLAEKFQHFLPKDPAKRAEVLNWLFWQAGSAPYLGGGFGHFFNYAPVKLQYPIDRFSMEAKRQLHVLDTLLTDREYIGGAEYSIADIAIWPWYGSVVLGDLYNAAEFLNVQEYPNLLAWSRRISDREAVKRGRMVNRVWGEPGEQLAERHSKQDIDNLLK